MALWHYFWFIIRELAHGTSTPPVGQGHTGIERVLLKMREPGKVGNLPPVFTYEATPIAPLVTVLTLARQLAPSGGLPGMPSHDFVALVYFARDGGSLGSGDWTW